MKHITNWTDSPKGSLSPDQQLQVELVDVLRDIRDILNTRLR